MKMLLERARTITGTSQRSALKHMVIALSLHAFNNTQEQTLRLRAARFLLNPNSLSVKNHFLKSLEAADA